jgi:hypothetical protein
MYGQLAGHGEECVAIVAVVGEAEAGCTDTVVAGREEDGDAAGSKLRKLLADCSRVTLGDGLLVVGVGGADDLW